MASERQKIQVIHSATKREQQLTVKLDKVRNLDMVAVQVLLNLVVTIFWAVIKRKLGSELSSTG